MLYDTIIIGAGLSGLAAGIRLAYYEQRVCILERHYTIGGLNSFYRLRGRHYDVGLHAVTNFASKGTKKGPLVRLLRQLRHVRPFSNASSHNLLLDKLHRRLKPKRIQPKNQMRNGRNRYGDGNEILGNVLNGIFRAIRNRN